MPRNFPIPRNGVSRDPNHVPKSLPAPQERSAAAGNRGAVVKATARLVDKIQDSDVDAALEVLRDAMKNASLNVRAPRLVVGGVTLPNNYETIPDHPTRIAAARLILDVKLKTDLLPMADDTGGDSEIDAQEQAKILRDISPDLALIVGVWKNGRLAVAQRSQKAAKILRKTEDIDLEGLPE